MTWNQLFIRQGFLLEEVGARVFDCSGETNKNLSFLFKSLDKAEVEYSFQSNILELHQEAITETDWLETVDYPGRGRGGWLWFRPGIDRPKVEELDTYISGLVSQLNRLGIYTKGSCDGHGGRAWVGLADKKDEELFVKLMIAAGIKENRIRKPRNSAFHLYVRNRKQLLNAAQRLSHLDKNMLGEDVDLQKQFLFLTLEKLLSISGASGNEQQIRDHIHSAIEPWVDHVKTDAYGNLMAVKRCGHGPTVLLSAHMDTAGEFALGRTLLKNGNKWKSSKGILGADDRAGLAILLETIMNSENFDFHGTIKFIFTVEEEIGLKGARNANDFFFWDVDAAIVADRRGSGDIVTSCGGYIPFCDERYGQFFEEMAEEAGLEGWECTPGGSSDTRIWAEKGIQSVNLSAGYQHEHTSEETLDVEACFGTYLLIKKVLEESRALNRVLRSINRGPRREAQYS